VKLRDLNLVEEFAGTDGRFSFATTEAFLQRFGLASLGEFKGGGSLSGNQSAITPLKRRPALTTSKATDLFCTTR
jgi:chromosome segregation and condensation protein ScpB